MCSSLRPGPLLRREANLFCAHASLEKRIPFFSLVAWLAVHNKRHHTLYGVDAFLPRHVTVVGHALRWFPRRGDCLDTANELYGVFPTGFLLRG